MEKYLQVIRQDLAREITSRGFTDFSIFKTDYPKVVNAFGVVRGRWSDSEYYGVDEDPEKIPY
jgi:hypothetical protein